MKEIESVIKSFPEPEIMNVIYKIRDNCVVSTAIFPPNYQGILYNKEIDKINFTPSFGEYLSYNKNCMACSVKYVDAPRFSIPYTIQETTSTPTFNAIGSATITVDTIPAVVKSRIIPLKMTTTLFDVLDEHNISMIYNKVLSYINIRMFNRTQDTYYINKLTGLIDKKNEIINFMTSDTIRIKEMTCIKK